MKLALLLLIALLSVNCSNVPKCKLAGDAQPKCHPDRRHVWHPDAQTELPYIAEQPKLDVKIRAVVVLVVGQDGTLCDYRSLTQALVKNGYAVYGSEHRTMRYDSLGSRHGHAVPWHRWVEDLRQFTSEVVRKDHPNLPIYYHGHSFGAVVAIETVSEYMKSPANRGLVPKGLILQSPAFAMLRKSSVTLTEALALPLSGLRVPQLTFMESRGMEMTTLSSWNCAWLNSDDRVKQGYTVGWFLQALKMGHKARLVTENDQLPPVLALEGKRDYVTLGGRPGSLFAEKQADYEAYLEKQKTTKHWDYRSYPGAHLLTEGPGKEKVVHDIIAWLDVQP